MVHGENRIPYRHRRRLSGLAGPDYDATISLGCPLSLKTHNMGNPHSYRIDRRLSGLAGPDYDATISFGLPLESENPQYGKSG